MATVTITTNDDRALQQALSQIEQGLLDASPLMRNVGEIALESVQYNFEVGGRPPWTPLSPRTLAIRKKRGRSSTRILFETGTLRNGIVYRPFADRVELGTPPSARAYAAIQNYGGMAGRSRKVRIPARPYMLLQDEDVEEIREETLRYLQQLGER